ncbi:MAG: Ig-like domain-containing protein [Kofleriaceae bacterium]
MTRNLVVVLLAGMVSIASADVMKRGYVVIPASHDLVPATVSHTIFLDRCVGGCTITKGSDGTQNQSSIVSGSVQLGAFGGSDTQWQALLSCVRATYAPFNVTITDQRPASGAYHHAVVAGTATQAGFSNGTLGVSPFSSNCSYIPNAISFSFANSMLSLPNPDVELCWTVSQETAHSWGLDHKLDKLDPMTYLENGAVTKVFQNQAGSCGEYSARQCACSYPGTGSSAMNAYALIMATFGSGTPDTTPPTVSITSPSNNASIMPGFAIAVQAADDVSISKVELRVDGSLITTDTSAPFSFTAPATLSQGSHHVEATATDSSNNTAKAAIDVMYGEACTTGGCSDSTQVCDDGHCVPGPTTTGGLGSPCTGNADCASGTCGDDGAGNQYCVTSCDPTNNQCPSGFGCVSATATTGVCWPGADNGGGGGCNTGGGGGAILAGLGFAAMLLTRRKRG